MPVMNQKDVQHYERTRYSKPDQWLVNFLEQRIVRGFMERYNLKGSNLLDIPCGFGRFSQLFLDAKIKLTSADVSHAMVRRTKEKLSAIDGYKNFSVASVKDLPFKSNSFDATFTARLLHHNFTIDDRIHILKELGRVSKRYVIVTMYRENLFHKLTRKIRRMKRIIIMLSDKEMEREIENAGLKIVEKKIMMPFLHSQVFLLLKKG
jgi:ubiquinone/menaquinone biosynthesis C-methylase UbiE